VVQSVELLVDAATDAAVRSQWARLAGAGLPSQARRPQASNRPHVTLSVATAIPAEVVDELGAALEGLPVPLRLGGLVVFGGSRRRVLARLVVPSGPLLAVHASVSRRTACCPGLVDLTRPGRWTPHITLARGLDDPMVARALTALGKVPDSDGEATSARRWDGDAKREWLLL
jgi:2'-5' RNA ligase